MKSLKIWGRKIATSMSHIVIMGYTVRERERALLFEPGLD